MKIVHKSVLIWFTPAEMYQLVADIEKYPLFLPWCDHARVEEDILSGVTAELGISFGGIRQNFVTSNKYTQDSKIQISLVNGPFSLLNGEWNFKNVGDQNERACKVTLDLTYDFKNITLGVLVGPVFDRIANSLLEAFVNRAKSVYG